MLKYRISKYNPELRNEYGEYKQQDWISYSDIGKIYNGAIFTKENYVEMEKKYKYVISKILQMSMTKKLKVKELEKYFSIDELENMLSNKQLALSENERYILQNIEEDKTIEVKDAEVISGLALRECIWCRLVSINCTIEFGYDFYAYAICDLINQKLIENFKHMGIYVEKLSDCCVGSNMLRM